MCGIIGYTGKRNVTEVLIKGLKALEYRGYDSSGVALYKDNTRSIVKAVGKVKQLEDKLESNLSEEYTMGIAHTRWATHGKVTEVNSHPHDQNKITIVHNGIIENYKEVKEELIKEGYTFKSETDTEIAAGLIDFYSKSKDILEALDLAMKKLRGSYALLITSTDTNNLYALRKNNPLIVGVGEKENFIASDISAILEYTNKYMEIEENEIFVITNEDVKVYKNKELINKEVKVETMTLENVQKGGYDHFMMKEIHEQLILPTKLVEKYYGNNEFSKEIIDLSKYKYIDIVACGSAYYAGLVGKSLLEEYADDLVINIDVASEYRYKKHYYKKDTLVIVISQSGETADTIAAMRLALDNNIDTLAIVNNQLSTISKECKYVIPMLAGPEIAVATTKGYFSQVIIFNLLVLKYLLSKKIKSEEETTKIIIEMKNLEGELKKIIDSNVYKDWAKDLSDKQHVYFIGRKHDYVMALEASLKLKELSYIHSDTYQAGELKHGSIALIEEDTPVIGLVTDEVLEEKTVSNIIETKARGANIFVLKTDNIKIDDEVSDKIFNIKNINEFTTPLLSIVFFQLLSYYVAEINDCDIDKPKNLAKSVTVE